MGKLRDNRDNSNNSNESYKEILQLLNEKYALPRAQLQEILEQALKHLKLTGENSFPVSIFTKKLTVLESIVKYLREEKGKTLSEIAPILGRNQRNLWHAYNNAKKKMSSRFQFLESDIFVPLSVFTEDKFSPSEAVVVYLKEQRQLSFREIAQILTRDDRTVWTTYNRAKKKEEHGRQ